MNFDIVITRPNLELAWRRINTASNPQYKRYFRDLYSSYELSYQENLDDLFSRIRGHSFIPKPCTKVFFPKATGLQRGYALLGIEDQILYQAIANVFGTKVYARRKRLEYTSVFSNIQTPERDSIFFFKRWQDSYRKFEDRIRENFNSGYKWIAQFDLAAYFDTISHELLIKTAFPRLRDGDFEERTLSLLKIWSCENLKIGKGHGIPQGPISSNMFAECFFLPIDEQLSRSFRYIRYVDDIRLFGSSEQEVRAAAIKLEQLCQNRGLIPQSKKFTITKAASVKEALGTLPSLTHSEHEGERTFLFKPKEATKLFKTSLAGRPQVIVDKARARHVLFNTGKSGAILGYSLRLINRHPEHTDAFVAFFNNYENHDKIKAKCVELLLSSPYEFVQGEMWKILTRMMDFEETKRFVRPAVVAAKDKTTAFSIKWGALHFLCGAERKGCGNYSKWIMNQANGILQSLLIKEIPVAQFYNKPIVKSFLLSESFEPGIQLAERLAILERTLSDYDVTIEQLQSQVLNVFKAARVVPSEESSIDPIGEVIGRRYGVKKWVGWKTLLGSEYLHIQKLLCQADPVYNTGKDKWLSHQNSFNHAVFLEIQKLLNSRGLPGAITVHATSKFGNMVDTNQPFARSFPNIAHGFFQTNKRRNGLPGSHPYEQRTGNRTRFLKPKEQKNLTRLLKDAYTELIAQFGSILGIP